MKQAMNVINEKIIMMNNLAMIIFKKTHDITTKVLFFQDGDFRISVIGRFSVNFEIEEELYYSFRSPYESLCYIFIKNGKWEKIIDFSSVDNFLIQQRISKNGKNTIIKKGAFL